MRVAMIGHKHYGSREGGVEVVVTELARRMAERGHEVVCFDRSGSDVMTGESKKSEERLVDGVHIVPVKTLDIKGLAALSSSVVATFRAIRWHPDVIHYHAEGPCVPLPIARAAGIKTVATIHGLDWKRAKWGKIASTYIKLGERAAVRHANEIVVLSRDAQEYFRRGYGRDTKLVPNGITSHKILPACLIDERWGLKRGNYLLYLGRLVPEKRPELLIEAFKSLNTDKRLVIAGGGSDTSEYERQLHEEAKEDSRILFTGFVEGQILEELYSNASVYVLPSDVEGMPMSLLEAMSYGCPCITSDIPECVDVLGRAGVVFSAGNVSSLAEAIKKLIDNESFARDIGERARLRVASTYDWDSIVSQTLELYSDIERKA